MCQSFFRTVALLVCVCCLEWNANAQLSVICTYDYQKALVKHRNCVNRNDPGQLSYLKVTAQSKTTEVHQFATFSELMDSTCKSGNLLFFIHGDVDNIDCLAKDKAVIDQQYDVDVLCFAWPSLSHPFFRRYNYSTSEQNCALLSQRFVEAVDSVNRYVGEHGINCTIMFHSLGNDFAKTYACNYLSRCSDTLAFNNVVLNAACCLMQGHSTWVDLWASHIRRSVFVIRNPDDKVLRAVQYFIKNRPVMGRSELTEQSENAIYIDVAQVVKQAKTFGGSHCYYAGQILKEIPILQQFYNTIFTNELSVGNSPWLEQQFNYYILTKINFYDY